MSSVRTLPADPDETAGPRANGWASSRIADFVLCALIPINMAVPFLPVEIPIAELAVMGLALVAMNVRPDSPPRPLWFPVLLVTAWLVLAVSTVVNDVDGARRLLHMANYVALALTLASGRVHTPSALRGFATGIAVAGASAFLNRLVPIFETGYGSRLTGLFGDPNVAGYYFLVFGCLGLAGTRSPTLRRWVFAAMTITVVLTLSRTALAGLVLAFAWLTLRSLGVGRIGMLLLGFAGWQATNVADRFRTWGPFQGRGGSDLLRERIQAAEELLVTQNPLLGNGAGTAKVQVYVDQFFFHSSYLGLRAEGGWILYAVFMGLLALVALRLTAAVRSDRQVWIEMALICGVIMGLSLGEVLLELPMAAALGIAMRQTLAPEEVADSVAETTGEADEAGGAATPAPTTP